MTVAEFYATSVPISLNGRIHEIRLAADNLYREIRQFFAIGAASVGPSTTEILASAVAQLLHRLLARVNVGCSLQEYRAGSGEAQCAQRP